MDDVLVQLSATRPEPIVVALVLVLLTTYGKAARWSELLNDTVAQTADEPEGSAAPDSPSAGRSRNLAIRLFPALVVGQMINTVSPARIGEIPRVVMGARASGLGRAYLLGSIALEKLVDGLCVLIAVAVLVPFLQIPDWVVRNGIGTLAAVGSLLLVVAVLVRYGERLLLLATGLLERISVRWGRKATAIMSDAVRGVAGIASWGARGRVAGWSALIWLTATATNVAVFQAVGLTDLGVVPATFLVVVGQIGGSVTSIPGRVGVFHALMIGGLGLFQVPVAAAFSFAVVLHLVVFGTQILLGLAFLWRDSLRVEGFSLFRSGEELTRGPLPNGGTRAGSE